VHKAAGLPAPDLSEDLVQAALRQALPDQMLHPTEAHTLLAWLGGLPSQALGHIHAVWANWMRRANEIDHVWPMHLFHAAHDMVSERLKQLGGEVKRVASEKLIALEHRYGRTGAILVFTTAVLLTPIPVPGTTLAPILVAEGIRAVSYTFWTGERGVSTH
jgi:hypothetical protein